MKFELNVYKQELTDEEILSDIKNTAERLGRDYISISYYRKMGSILKQPSNVILEHGKTLYL